MALVAAHLNARVILVVTVYRSTVNIYIKFLQNQDTLGLLVCVLYIVICKTALSLSCTVRCPGVTESLDLLYISSLSPLTLSPSLIRSMVSGDVKHQVYLLRSITAVRNAGFYLSVMVLTCNALHAILSVMLCSQPSILV